MDFSIGIKMGRFTILSLWIGLVCLSKAIVHLGQELVKYRRGKITGLIYFIIIILFYYFDNDYTANQTKLGFS